MKQGHQHQASDMKLKCMKEANILNSPLKAQMKLTLYRLHQLLQRCSFPAENPVNLTCLLQTPGCLLTRRVWCWYLKMICKIWSESFNCGKVCLICPKRDFSRFMHQLVWRYSVTFTWNKRPFTCNSKSSDSYSTETSLILKQSKPGSCLVTINAFWFMDN